MQFDQVALQDQGLEVRIAEQHLKVVDMGDHRRDLGRVGGIAEIAADPVFQVHGFPDVNDGPAGVLHQVAAGRIGQRPDLFLQFFSPVDHRHTFFGNCRCFLCVTYVSARIPQFRLPTMSCSSFRAFCRLVWYSPVSIPVVRKAR